MNYIVNLKLEDELILKCARTYIDNETKDEIIKLISNNIVNWDYIHKKSRNHSLRSIIYWQLNQICPEIIPNEFMVPLKKHFDYNLRKNMLMLVELQKIIKLLEFNKIVGLPYKGPVLALIAYNNLSIREFNDLDIYVDRKDILTLKRILILNDYEIKLNFSPYIEAQYMQSQREYKFFNKEKDILLEVHWNIPGISFSFPHESFFQVKKVIPLRINNFTFNSFSKEDLILILSIHAGGHLWQRLSWISDINELIRHSNDLNWEIIIKKARYLQVAKILCINLFLANELFDLEIPSSMKNIIEEDDSINKICADIIENIFSSKPPNIIKKIILRYKIRENQYLGLNDIWKIFTVPNTNEWKDFEKIGIKSFYYIIRRPIQIMKRLRE
jgi:hypothetical protein